MAVALDPTGDAARPRRRPVSRRGAYRLGVVAILAGCAAVRLAFSASSLGGLDADEAATAVMAHRILGGDQFLFFAGQRYLGSAEQYLLAGLFAVLPDTAFVVRLVPIAFAVAVCAMVVAIARRTLDSPRLALLAGVLFAVGPYYAIFKSVKSHGSYGAGQALAAGGLLLALTFDPAGRRAPLVAAAFGLICGFAAYEQPIAALVLIPAALWALGSARGHRRRTVGPALGGFVVGGAPLLVALAVLDRPPSPPLETGPLAPTSLSERAAFYTDPLLSMFLGIEAPGGQTLAAWLPAGLIGLGAAAALGAAMWARRDGLTSLATLRTGARRPVDALLLAAVLSIPIVLSSERAILRTEPRYLYPLYIVLPVLLAGAVGALASPRRRVVAAAGLVAFVSLFSLLSFRRVEESGVPLPPNPSSSLLPVVPVVDEARLGPVVAALRAQGVDGVWAPYDLAYPLALSALSTGDGRDLAVAAFDHDRFPELRAAAFAARTPVLAAPVGREADAVTRALAARGLNARRETVGHVVVFAPDPAAARALGPDPIAALGLAGPRIR